MACPPPPRPLPPWPRRSPLSPTPGSSSSPPPCPSRVPPRGWPCPEVTSLLALLQGYFWAILPCPRACPSPACEAGTAEGRGSGVTRCPPPAHTCPTRGHSPGGDGAGLSWGWGRAVLRPVLPGSPGWGRLCPRCPSVPSAVVAPRSCSQSLGGEGHPSTRTPIWWLSGSLCCGRGAALLSLLGPCQLLSIFVSVWNSRYPRAPTAGPAAPPGVPLLLPAPSGTAPGGGSARQQGGAGGTMGAPRWVWLSRVPQWHRGTSTACVQDAPGSAMFPWWHRGRGSLGAQRGVLPCLRAQHPFPLGSSCHLRDSRVAGGTGPASGTPGGRSRG